MAKEIRRELRLLLALREAAKSGGPSEGSRTHLGIAPPSTELSWMEAQRSTIADGRTEVEPTFVILVDPALHMTGERTKSVALKLPEA